MVDATPDMLRLLALLPLAWAAWSDHHTRRVDRRVWAVLIVIGGVAAVWQVDRIAPVHTVDEYRILTQLIIVPPVTGTLAAILHRAGAFGGADAKALFALGLVFPTPIEYTLPVFTVQLPTQQTQIALIAIGFNGMLFAVLLYLLKMWIENLSRGERSLNSLMTSKVAVHNIPETPGQMKWTDKNGEAHTLDLDALRMYLRWRGISVVDLIQQPDAHRCVERLDKVYRVDDGAIYSEITSSHPLASKDFDSHENPVVADRNVTIEVGDIWGAEAFLESIKHGAYGTTAEELRQGIKYIQNRESIRIQPAFPLIVPLFFGAVAAVTVGDIVAILALTF